MIRKKHSLLLLLLLAAVCLSGCSVRPETARKQSLAYLKEQYTDTFTARTYLPGGWAYTYDTVVFSSEKYPAAEVEVRVYRNEDGTSRCEDNYYQWYMKSDAIQYGRSLLGGECTVKVRFRQSVWSDMLGGARSFEAWKQTGTACMDIFLITSEPMPGDAQREIAERVAGDKISGMVVFYVTEDEALLETVELDDILNNEKQYVSGKSEYTIGPDFTFTVR